uniref:Neutral ceramidase n=1 Tax=Schistosoma mansoni TaxID=6183 RepID=A0A3Q0KPD2_SCHMA
MVICKSFSIYSSFISIFWSFLFSPHINGYLIGVGIHDITGPITDINMMGYGNMKQNDNGLHLRLFSRAFIIQENSSSQPIVIVIIDAGMVSQAVKIKVIDHLKNRYDNGLFTHQNVLISATHTHSGPAGYLQYVLYSFTSLGYVPETFQPLVEGIVNSIDLAYSNMKEGKILKAEGDLHNASINRSPAAYLENPVEEQARYGENVDKNMILLKFVTMNNTPIGMINWFAVHAVSMNFTNTLVSSDNKGLAAILFEQKMNHNQMLGKGPFVAAFAQANEGDVSPNTAGPRCIDTGLPCDFVHSSCGGRTQNCIAYGPGSDMFESTKIIAYKQFEKAWSLFNNATTEINGTVNFIHQFIDMTNISLNYKNYSGHTCEPAMGFSFAAGTTDGPGDFDFIQGTTRGSLFWNIVRDFIKTPSEKLIKCQAPKPILVATGEMNVPYPWQPSIVETQIVSIGPLLIVALPGEFTTMSGRRIREAVIEAANDASKENNPSSTTHYEVILSGLSNVYSSYIATPEEYQLQRYEGASTIYGPLTLPAYVNQFSFLARALVKGEKISPGTVAPYFFNEQFSFVPKILFDTAPLREPFGTVIKQPNSTYYKKNDTVEVYFVTASPRNNVFLNGTYLTVEIYNKTLDEWNIMYTDANWETKFTWNRDGFFSWLLGRSYAIIEWTVSSIDGICIPGTYRIKHFGTSKNIFGRKTHFSGVTNNFTVLCEHNGEDT